MFGRFRIPSGAGRSLAMRDFLPKRLRIALSPKNAVSVLSTQIAGPYEDKIAHM